MEKRKKPGRFDQDMVNVDESGATRSNLSLGGYIGSTIVAGAILVGFLVLFMSQSM